MAQLRGYIDDAVTTIPVDDTTGFPTNGGVVTIETEEISYIFATDKALLGCVRGYNSTTAVEHDDHTTVVLSDTAAPLYSLPEFAGADAPVDNETGVNQAPTGSRYTQLSNGSLFINTGDMEEPTWTMFQAGTDLGITELTGDVTAGPGTGSQAATLSNDVVTDAHVATGAAIAMSKLDLSITDAEVDAAAAIAYSKLDLVDSIVDADINTAAAIDQSKLSLAITDAEVDASAAIAYSKLAPLTDTHILVGNGSNVATDVALSGDATLANTGAITLATVNSNVGSFERATVTVNAKGLVTAASAPSATQFTLKAAGQFSTSNAAYQDVTALSRTFTPSTNTKKVKVTMCTSWQINDPVGAQMQITVFRDGNDLATSGGSTIIRANDGGGTWGMGSAVIVFIDSPATASEVTYQVKMKSDGTHDARVNATQSSLICEEI